MKYSKLAQVYESLESTSSKLEKRDILAKLLSETDDSDLEKIVLLATGRVYPMSSEEDLGVASKMIERAISKSTGFPEKAIVDELRKTGDLGLVAENLVKSRKQSTLMQRSLDVERVFRCLKRLSEISGKGSQDRKLSLVAELLFSATPKEAKYVARTALGTLRIGVAEGTLRDAIAKAFDVDAEKVENAWNMMPDYAKITRIAKSGGNRELELVKAEVGTSIQVLLCEKAPGLVEAIEKFEEPAIEVKYDGARVQIHKSCGKITIFTRRLENVTRQFPDMVRMVKSSVCAESCILDGEMIGIDTKTGKPLPFQLLSQRIQRKHDIEKMVKEIPIQVNLFDVVHADGKTLFEMTLKERRAVLESIVKPIEGKFQFAKQLVTKDAEKAKSFYEKALKDGHEGVIVKNMSSNYQPGRRVGYWLKVKPIMDPLDLVITGAEWGEGKRANWLSSFTLACLDEDSGDFLECGMMGTGLTDEEFKSMTEKLKHLITADNGRTVKIEPKIVFEIGYEEIQKSSKYSSGFAMRFPRLIRDRSADKSPDDADTIKRLGELYKAQKGR